MAEYIERETAKAKIMEKFKFVPARIEINEVLNSIPAADVRPVVKARWVYTDMSRLVCSNCGSPVAFALKADGWHHGDYCPNCGAWMEES